MVRRDAFVQAILFNIGLHCPADLVQFARVDSLSLEVMAYHARLAEASATTRTVWRSERLKRNLALKKLSVWQSLWLSAGAWMMETYHIKCAAMDAPTCRAEKSLIETYLARALAASAGVPRQTFIFNALIGFGACKLKAAEFLRLKCVTVRTHEVADTHAELWAIGARLHDIAVSEPESETLSAEASEVGPPS